MEEMDRICICDLLTRCILGINDSERREKQDVLINLAVYTDLRKAGKSDRIEDTVDYRALKKRILAMAESSGYFLEEALAEAVAEMCLDTPGVRRADVRVEKPNALRFARSVAVEITRQRPA
ncbi:MAG TPA: dihydroneopterin aldolase [Sideroxyarcus sp.]|nr:dihydroneopterin aldolase [Sideroxyarcus sp.]